MLTMNHCPEVNNSGPEYRPWLLFLIEEGFKGDLISKYRDDFAEMDRCLENIYSALAELECRYKAAVIIYPIQFYDRNAYGIRNAAQMDRIHPALRHALDFFERNYTSGRGTLSFFLEMYSSGNATEQNGELSDLQPPPLYRDGKDRRTGMSMDLDTAAALKAFYPNAFAGIRFHEIYGSDLVMKVTGGHGFLLEPEIVRGAVDLCKKEDLVLYWTDSCWLMNIPEAGGKRYVKDGNYQPYFDTRPYKDLQTYAVEALGKKVIFSYANNNYHLANNLERLSDKIRKHDARDNSGGNFDNPVYFTSVNGSHPIDESLCFDLPYRDHPLKHIEGADWGISNQSWFWSEMVFTIGGKKYYAQNDDDCPVEIISAFVRKALKERAGGIQFEPAWYLFNSGNPHRRDTYGYETRPDYTPRTNFLRLKEVLLSPENDRNIPDDPNAYFDTDMQRLMENSMGNPPAVYSRNTLFINGRKSYNAMSCFDFYNKDKRWITGQPYRIPGSWHTGEIICLQRIAINGSGDDVLLQVKKERDGSMVLYFYMQNGVLIGTDKETLSIGPEESLITLTTANLIPRIYSEGDADELIMVKRCNTDKKLHLEIYSVEYDPGVSLRLKCIQASTFAPDGFGKLYREIGRMKESDFGGILGIRDNTALYRDKTRPLDKVILFQRKKDKVRLKIFAGQGGYHELDMCGSDDGCPVEDGWTPLYAAALDINCDRADEILLPKRNNQGITWECFTLLPDRLELVETYADPYSDYLGDIVSITGMRKVVMTNA